mgnify:CR=1 FL=1
MGVLLKKYENTFETQKEALQKMKDLKSEISKDEKIKTKFRIVKI